VLSKILFQSERITLYARMQVVRGIVTTNVAFVVVVVFIILPTIFFPLQLHNELLNNNNNISCGRRDQVCHVQLQRPGHIGDRRHDHYERPF